MRPLNINTTSASEVWLGGSTSHQAPHSRVDTDVLMEVGYSCNFLAVSDSSTCPDIGTS